jgi:hypothetical protein
VGGERNGKRRSRRGRETRSTESVGGRGGSKGGGAPKQGIFGRIRSPRGMARAGDAEKVISSGSCLELEMRMPTPSGVRGFSCHRLLHVARLPSALPAGLAA